MANTRALDRRRKSVRNIRKITRTMELIATARFKRAMDRASAAGAYARRMSAMVANLARSGAEVSHPLLEGRGRTATATLLVLSANRGLCGGYNSGVLRHAFARLNELRGEVPEVRLEVSGKRGMSAFRFRGIQRDETFTHFEHKPSFEEVDVQATRYLEAFQAGQIDRLDVAYSKYESLSRQRPVVETLLPLGGLEGHHEEEGAAAELQYEFFPSAESILEEIVPASFRARLFKCFLDAAVGEQIARMMAMKAATENADSMISRLTMTYNRARQGDITAELLEVIGSANALTG